MSALNLATLWEEENTFVVHFTVKTLQFVCLLNVINLVTLWDKREHLCWSFYCKNVSVSMYAECYQPGYSFRTEENTFVGHFTVRTL